MLAQLQAVDVVQTKIRSKFFQYCKNYAKKSIAQRKRPFRGWQKYNAVGSRSGELVCSHALKLTSCDPGLCLHTDATTTSSPSNFQFMFSQTPFSGGALPVVFPTPSFASLFLTTSQNIPMHIYCSKSQA
jgi:hypothetical protein